MYVPLIFMWSLSGSMCASSCSWEIGVERVQPVEMQSAGFCVVCMEVSAGLTSKVHLCDYRSVVLFVGGMSSLECPAVVFVSARRTLNLDLALVFTLCVCALEVIPRSKAPFCAPR